MSVAVNVSPVQFRSRDIALMVERALAETGLAPRRLEIEVTESLLIQDSDSTRANLLRLKELGVRIALDDFGTGYSSLSYLRSFPFDKIKIDRSFITDMVASGPSALAIVRAVTQLARSLDMTTTAEGIETEEQLAMVRAEGCTEAQGYLLGKPMRAADVRQVLAPCPAAAVAAA
jgi:EAL domain-containing protein (putative c-di-GMP-specific phosphodiesterase class I)